MNIHAFSTGTVQITHHWLKGSGSYPKRLFQALTDSQLSEPLPIWCFLIEHPEGLILIDTGIPQNANQPVWFPPHMRLTQGAAPFQIASAQEEIGTQLQAKGFSPKDVRWVILTHLHQDHEGGLHHFPKAQFIVSRAEWAAAQGWQGRMKGYLNQRWFAGFQPRLIDFDQAHPSFGAYHPLTQAKDVQLVPTFGHSEGHLSVILETPQMSWFFAGDASYSQQLLLEDALDGVSPNARAVHQTHQRIRHYAQQHPTVYLPSHEWAAKQRLEQGLCLSV